MSKLLLFFLLLVATVASANDVYLDINLSSSHVKSGYYENQELTPYNEKNLGLGITYTYNPNLDFKIGFYENSYYKTSVYVGAHPNINILNDNRMVVEPGLLLGVVSGYEEEDNAGIEIGGGLNVIILPTLRLGYESVFFNIGYLPGAVATLQLQIKIR
jgi:hypothetical protein